MERNRPSNGSKFRRRKKKKFFFGAFFFFSPMKRGRTDALTGGSGDVNPQWMSGQLTLAGGDVTTQAQINLPVSRIPDHKGKVMVIELLKFFVNMPPVPYSSIGTALTGTARLNSQCILSVGPTGLTSAGGLKQLSDVTTLASINDSRLAIFNSGGSLWAQATPDPQVFDCTDGAGHGVLVGADSIYVAATTANYVTAATFQYKILYRFKEVNLTEYIGIVQSQQ